MSSCDCKKYDVSRLIQAALEDETLKSNERQQLLQDLRADYSRAPPCPKKHDKN